MGVIKCSGSSVDNSLCLCALFTADCSQQSTGVWHPRHGDRRGLLGSFNVSHFIQQHFLHLITCKLLELYVIDDDV